MLDVAEYAETVKVARDLIRIDTSNRGSGDANPERPAADYVVSYLSDLGLKPQLFESAPGRANVVTRIAGRERELPALVLHGHLDVVPADSSTWSVDPFAGVIKDGMLWGRGAVDMKDMDAMMLTATAELLRAGERPRRDIILTFFADEEAGGEYGSQWMVKHHPEVFAGAGSAISEVGGYSIEVAGQRAYLIQTGEKAMEWISLTARGTAAHGSRPWKDNAVSHLAAAIVKIAQQQWPVQLSSTNQDLLAELCHMLDKPVGSDPDEIVAALGAAGGFIAGSLRNTANPTGLAAGYKHNVIPESASALIDVRPMPGQSAAVLAKLQEIVGPDIAIARLTSGAGFEAPFSGELIGVIKNLLHKHDPAARVLPYLLPGGTDNKALAQLGIVGYGFAPLQLPAELDFPGMFHGVDERVPLSALEFGHRVLSDLLRTY